MAGLLDYIEAPFQAIGGLFGAGQSASPQAAPAQAPLAASSAWTPIPQMPVHSTAANFVDNLFGSPQREHDQQAYNQALLQWQNQNLAQGFPDLPPEVQSALRVGGPSAIQEYVKNRLANTTLKDGETAILGGDRDHPFYAPATMSGGQSRQFGGPGGQMDTAPMLGVTPSGFAYTQTPTGTGRTGFLPPYQSNPVTNNSGFVAPPPGVPIAPAVDGRVHLGGGGTAQPPQTGAQPMPGAPPQVSGTGAPPLADPAAPRGIRNNNPGNVRALPNGQMWAGQTGTDEQGYAIFADPKAGVHATLTNLDAYANRHGISTPQAIAARWSPNAPGYGPFIAQQLGVKPGDRINLKDPAVQGQVAQAIFKMENGPQAMQARFPSAQPQAQATPAQGTGQVQPASTPPGYLPSSVQGRTNALVSPDEAIRLGLAPGRWERDPAGKLVQASPAPKGDTDRVDSLAATTQGLHLLLQEQDAFLAHNKNVHTGLAYVNPEVHGVGLNPYLAYQEGHSPDVKALSASEGKQLFMVKPENAGARILQSELPFWQIQTQNMSATPQVNRGIRNDTAGKLAAAQQQSDFYQKYIYEHGNLNGVDQAYAAQNGKGAAGAPRPPGQSQPPQKTRIRTYNPQTGGLE